MTAVIFTKKIRHMATWFWCLGFIIVAFDFLSLPFLEWKASLSYIFFAVAAFLVMWAEKREFSTRILLYRLHDAVIYSPWKYLLLYFLWISVFSPFTSDSKQSLVYAANGWVSLLFVGVFAQFIFCERGMNGPVLLFQPLKLLFRLYSFAVVILFANLLLHLFLPNFPIPILVNALANLFLYFIMGLPYLLWDFFKEGRRLLPRPWSAFVLVIGSTSVLLVGKKIHFMAMLFCFATVIAFFLYKKFRWRKIFLLAAAVAVLVTVLISVLLSVLDIEPWASALNLARRAVESKMQASWVPALEILLDTKGMGQGMGLSALSGVWSRVVAEAGLVGIFFYASYFLEVLRDLYRVRRSIRVVVSNISFVSIGVFLLFLSHYVENPYGAYVWIWYAIWGLFASTSKKKVI